MEQSHLLVHTESFIEIMDDRVRVVVNELCYIDVVRTANPDVLLNGTSEGIPTNMLRTAEVVPTFEHVSRKPSSTTTAFSIVDADFTEISIT